tara:strand:- start:1371 stop:1883 length:513 start_codon:yes stop_codon:yes gene_type:complete
MVNQDTKTIVDKIKDYATCLFSSTMFGKPEHINFDHDIVYYIPPPNDCSINTWPYGGVKYKVAGEIRDLLNIDYPSSLIEDVYNNKQQYSFSLIAARFIDVQDDEDSVEQKFSDLENKVWKLIERLSDCDIIVMPGVQITRDVGTFNDKLVTVTFSLELDVYSFCIEPQC